MNIASLVLRTQPARIEELRQAIGDIPGCEIHIASPQDGLLIVTVEDSTEQTCADTLLAMQQLEHVTSLTLAYEYSEPAC